MRLLIIDDKVELCDNLRRLFHENKCSLDIANDGETGVEMARKGAYSVIMLDIGMPGISGFKVLETLRLREITTPVLMLTAWDTLEDKVAAFNLGADDYLIKPFEFKELLVRVKALARRSVSLVDNMIIVGNVSINRRSFEVKMGGVPVKMSLREAKVLEVLFLRMGEYVSKEAILDILCGRYKNLESNNVEVYVHYIRKKFPKEHSGFAIETKQGVGYRLIEGTGGSDMGRGGQKHV